MLIQFRPHPHSPLYPVICLGVILPPTSFFYLVTSSFQVVGLKFCLHFPSIAVPTLVGHYLREAVKKKKQSTSDMPVKNSTTISSHR
jgi:hypothetical protein